MKDICNELDVRSLCHKILQNVSTLLNADRGSLFLVQGGGLSACQHDHHRPITTISKRLCSPRRPLHANVTVGCLSKDDHSTAVAGEHKHHHHHHHNHHHHHYNNQSSNDDHVPNNPPTTAQVLQPVPPVEEAAVSGLIVGSPVGSTNVGSLAPKNSASTHHYLGGCQSKCLVSKLFDVCSRSTLQEMEKKKEIHIPWGTGIVGYVAESGEPVNIPDAYKVFKIYVNVNTNKYLFLRYVCSF